MESWSQREERLGRRLGGVVEDGLHAVVRHCGQVRLLVRHCLEYGGATEIHRDFDRFERGDGGKEGACVSNQLGLRRSLLDRWPSPSKKTTAQDAEKHILGRKGQDLEKHEY